MSTLRRGATFWMARRYVVLQPPDQLLYTAQRQYSDIAYIYMHQRKGIQVIYILELVQKDTEVTPCMHDERF